MHRQRGDESTQQGLGEVFIVVCAAVEVINIVGIPS